MFAAHVVVCNWTFCNCNNCDNNFVSSLEISGSVTLHYLNYVVIMFNVLKMIPTVLKILN